MTAILLIFAVTILFAAAVAWRLSTQRPHPPLPDYSAYEPHGDLPSVPEGLRAFHSAASTAGAQQDHA